MSETDLSQTIADSAAAPRRVQTEAVTVEGQPLRDVVAADEYLARKRASSRAHRGIGVIKLVPPGAV